MNVVNQLVGRAEPEGVVSADLDVELSFDRTEELNVMQRIPLRSVDHSGRVVELRNLQYRFGKRRQSGEQLLNCNGRFRLKHAIAGIARRWLCLRRMSGSEGLKRVAKVLRAHPNSAVLFEHG